MGKIIKVVTHELHEKIKAIDALYEVYLTYGSDKEFALAHSKTPNFGFVMSKARGRDSFTLAKNYLLSTFNKLIKAREWLIELDPSIFDYMVIEE